MSPGELKPILTALVLPPAGPLLLALAGLLLMGRRWLGGAIVSLLGIGLLWFLSCNAVGVGLARTLLPQVEPLNVRSAQMANVQAIVILGGGVNGQAPEYGRAQPSAATLERVRYGAWLARQTKKPLAFAGGVGWAAGSDMAPEAEVARAVLHDDYGLELRWSDDRSRDTAQNATRMAEAMRGDRIQRIALVTQAWHMPRARAAYEKAGFQVTPAPTGFAFPRERELLEWLPSAHGLDLSRSVLREWLGRMVGAY
ncbi:YdcF family protein [Caenimonas terrae]|uniref:YdcF family protein n=1 Tax=Caenimonas terrae TaxID=696074 RepID=A0ABW0NDP7_9BURK